MRTRDQIKLLKETVALLQADDKARTIEHDLIKLEISMGVKSKEDRFPREENERFLMLRDTIRQKLSKNPIVCYMNMNSKDQKFLASKWD